MVYQSKQQQGIEFRQAISSLDVTLRYHLYVIDLKMCYFYEYVG